MTIMYRIMSLIMILFWLVIPLFWVPVHAATGVARRAGSWVYLMVFLLWLPFAFLVYEGREAIWNFSTSLPAGLRLIGFILLFTGILVHIWTSRLLGVSGLIGLPEVFSMRDAQLITNGPFGIVRHPTYLGHTLMFSGAFFLTGNLLVGIVAILDFVIVNTAIIPLEEKELLERFGEDYRRYMARVPRFIPHRKE